MAKQQWFPGCFLKQNVVLLLSFCPVRFKFANRIQFSDISIWISSTRNMRILEK